MEQEQKNNIFTTDMNNLQNRLKNLEEQLSNFDFEERVKGTIDWNLHSAGGIGFAIRYKK